MKNLRTVTRIVMPLAALVALSGVAAAIQCGPACYDSCYYDRLSGWVCIT